MTDRELSNTAKEIQIDFSSASNINSPLYLIAAHQKTQRSNPADQTVNLPNNRFNKAIFDLITVRNYCFGIDSVRCPKKPIKINYDDNNYLDQCRELHLI